MGIIGITVIQMKSKLLVVKVHNFNTGFGLGHAILLIVWYFTSDSIFRYPGVELSKPLLLYLACSFNFILTLEKSSMNYETGAMLFLSCVYLVSWEVKSVTVSWMQMSLFLNRTFLSFVYASWGTLLRGLDIGRFKLSVDVNREF